MKPPRTSGVLIVDVQRDFCAGGALEVPGGDGVVPVINEFVARRPALPVYSSRDWHPPVTRHFRTHGGDWPSHCVADTPGAAPHPGLDLPDSTIVVTKGDTPDAHGYSAFDGHLPNRTSFLEALQRQGITHLYVAGLATDYCVKATVLDARQAGLDVTVLRDGIAAVDVTSGDGAAALAEMQEAGAVLARTADLGG